MSRYSPERIQEIRDHLSVLEACGVSVADFAREINVAPWTVYQWRRRFGSGVAIDGATTGEADRRADLIEVEQSVSADAIEIVANSVTIRVPRAFDADDLRRVIEVVQAC